MASYGMAPDEINTILQEIFVGLSSVSPRGALVYFIKNKYGSMHICINYVQLNKVTINNKYLITYINDLFNQHQGVIVFYQIDLRSSYHRLRIKAEEICKTAFRTLYGR